jgi:polyvinyl alcohol dehydrogenase (cytochrome)
VSSVEEVPAAQPNYECCTFRGSVVAPRGGDGNQIWKTYTVQEAPQQVGKNSKGTALWGPAGAAVWSARPSTRAAARSTSAPATRTPARR